MKLRRAPNAHAHVRVCVGASNRVGMIADMQLIPLRVSHNDDITAARLPPRCRGTHLQCHRPSGSTLVPLEEPNPDHNQALRHLAPIYPMSRSGVIRAGSYRPSAVHHQFHCWEGLQYHTGQSCYSGTVQLDPCLLDMDCLVCFRGYFTAPRGPSINPDSDDTNALQGVIFTFAGDAGCATSA